LSVEAPLVNFLRENGKDNQNTLAQDHGSITVKCRLKLNPCQSGADRAEQMKDNEEQQEKKEKGDVL